MMKIVKWVEKYQAFVGLSLIAVMVLPFAVTAFGIPKELQGGVLYKLNQYQIENLSEYTKSQIDLNHVWHHINTINTRLDEYENRINLISELFERRGINGPALD